MDQRPSTSDGIEEKSGEPAVKRLQRSWLGKDVFKDWLASHEDNRKAVCTACNIILSCGKSDLIRHSQSKKHDKNMIKSRNVNPSVLLPALNINNSCVDHDKIKIAEIKLAAFYATHNVAFEVINDMVLLLKDIFTDSEIARSNIVAEKMYGHVTNVIAKREVEKLISNLRNIKFSVLLDESTTITNDKVFCILIKYFSLQSKSIVTELLELVPLDATDCSAENLYSAFEHCFKSKEIPICNILGMASDNASVMEDG